MIPDETLKQWRALANAATEGPWIPKHVKTVYLASGEYEHEVRSTINGCTVAAIRFRSTGPGIGDDPADRDVAFIAAAREAMPQLLAEVEGLRALLAGCVVPFSVRELLSERSTAEAGREWQARSDRHLAELQQQVKTARAEERERCAREICWSKVEPCDLDNCPCHNIRELGDE